MVSFFLTTIKTDEPDYDQSSFISKMYNVIQTNLTFLSGSVLNYEMRKAN